MNSLSISIVLCENNLKELVYRVDIVLLVRKSEVRNNVTTIPGQDTTERIVECRSKAEVPPCT